MSLTRLLLRLFLGRRLPITSGELRVRGPAAPVTVRRDANGVPHIDAESERDAVFGLGFCQGQDRAGQLEVLWRVGRGRLAEWVGPGGLGADRLSRRIGFRRAAEKQLAAADAGPRTQLEAFAAGVSAAFAAGFTKKPHEFAILGGEPSPWDAADVLAILKLQSFALPSNWDLELARLRILLADGPAALAALDSACGQSPSGSEGIASDPRSRSGSDQLADDLAALRDVLPQGGGSNNWVIAGGRTASGKPLLANDPHLGPSVPAPWYLSHIRCPEWEAAGAGLAGSPGFAIGHNGFAAWGVTAGLTDNSDLFVETLSADGKSAKQPDGTFAPCEVLREVIRVKGQPDVTEEVVVTPRGPVVSPLAPDVCLVPSSGARQEHVTLSLRAIWLEPLPVNGFLGVVRAKSFEEFRRCFEHWPLLPLNVVYADANGTTGYQLVGQLPRRAGGNGTLPRPADRADSGWTGLVPFDEMPHASDFPAGYFATANTDPAALVPGPHPPELGVDFHDPYRLRAITDALAAKDTGWTIEDCAVLQRDVRSIPWEELRDTVLSLTPTDADSRAAVELLRDWDGRADSESPPACVFELFLAALCVRVARAKAPKSWAVALGHGGSGPLDDNLFGGRRVGHLVWLIREQPAGWFDSWPAEMERVLGDVVRKLRGEVGPGPAYWAWGHVRHLKLKHPLFGKHGRLGPVFNLGPVPMGGDGNTVCQAGLNLANPTADVNNLPNLRAVFDLADLAKSRFVLCGGQSGNPLSDHHADQFELWRAGESITIPWLQADVVRAARDTLRLLPSS